MKTTTATTNTASYAKERANKNQNSKFWDDVEFSRYGIISILVLIVGCCGGIAASFGANADILQLALVAFPSIISLALILAVAPMRVIVYASVIAIILDIIVIAF